MSRLGLKNKIGRQLPKAVGWEQWPAHQPCRENTGSSRLNYHTQFLPPLLINVVVAAVGRIALCRSCSMEGK